MTRARILQEVRQMRFEELYGRRQRRDVTMAEAAEMQGVMGSRGPPLSEQEGLRPCSP